MLISFSVKTNSSNWNKNQELDWTTHIKTQWEQENVPGFCPLPTFVWMCSTSWLLRLFQGLNTLSGRRQWHPTLVLLSGKSHGWRSLVGCSPWGREESDMTEQLHFHFSLSWIGEGNGNPLQCSCLENPRDGGAWWAAVYGVAQGRTQLKQLSSSSSNMP